MPRSDQSQTAILGALSIMPMTGYTLRQQIRDILGHFWSESLGQIYPTLAALEQQKLVQREVPGSSRSTTYSITPAGITRLRELLAESPQRGKPRNGTMLRLFFGAQLGPVACRALVTNALVQATDQLAALQREREELFGDATLAADAPYIALTISAGEHTARATIAWANESLATLARLGSS